MTFSCRLLNVLRSLKLDLKFRIEFPIKTQFNNSLRQNESQENCDKKHKYSNEMRIADIPLLKSIVGFAVDSSNVIQPLVQLSNRH